MQIAIKQSKAKFSKNYKQLKVPETSQTTSVYNSKLNRDCETTAINSKFPEEQISFEI